MQNRIVFGPQFRNLSMEALSDALADCLTDMSWHGAKGFVILFDSPEEFADNAPDDFQTALSIFMEAADFWLDEGKTFLVLVHGPGAKGLGLTEVES